MTDQIKFADSYPSEMQFVDVLIGQDVELEFATSETKILGPKATPGTIKTNLGWILCGPLSEVQRRKKTRTMRVQITNEELNENMGTPRPP